MTPTRRGALAAGVALVTGCHGTVRGRTPPACPARVGHGSDARPDYDADARLGFVGDVMLGRDVDERWDGRDPTGVWDGMADRLDALDGLVLNLECCLSTRGERRPGRTYHFRADPDWAVPALRAAGTTVASLANNHLLDFGPGALADTREALASAGVAHAGAGPDRETAFDPAVASAGGLDVGVLALTDQSRSYAAGPGSPGTAYLSLDHRNPRTRETVGDALETLARRGADLVVASLHWGPNWVVRPAPDQRAFARWLIDQGVDAVHGHSAHVLQGVETYRGRPVLYDCGDFVDDYLVKEDLHNDRSALFELVVRDGELAAVRARPVEIVDERVRPASEEADAWVRDRLRELSAPFGTEFERDGRGLTVPLACQ